MRSMSPSPLPAPSTPPVPEAEDEKEELFIPNQPERICIHVKWSTIPGPELQRMGRVAIDFFKHVNPQGLTEFEPVKHHTHQSAEVRGRRLVIIDLNYSYNMNVDISEVPRVTYIAEYGSTRQFGPTGVSFQKGRSTFFERFGSLFNWGPPTPQRSSMIAGDRESGGQKQSSTTDQSRIDKRATY